MKAVSRRSFMKKTGVAAAAVSAACAGVVGKSGRCVKPIRGSWFEFQHHNRAEGIYWNPPCAAFTCVQWKDKVGEIAGIGMEYLVLMDTALDFRAFYETDIFPRYEIACGDPMEAVLSAGDIHGVKFFIGGGFYGDWMSPRIISDPEARKRRLRAIEEIARLYGHHESFHGWYWPNEAFINKHFSEHFIKYVNECSGLARSLMPGTRTLIAPYGTRVAVPDDRFAKQLEEMDVDIIAYQDEVGVRKSRVEELPAFYEGLRRVHDRVGKAALWADMEIFEFEGEVYRSALLPARFSRVRRQMEALSPFVDTILVYQYQGMMNEPGSVSFAGHPASVELYSDYAAWLEETNRRGMERERSGKAKEGR